MCDTGVVNNVNYDTALKMLLAHANAAIVVEYWAVSGTGLIQRQFYNILYQLWQRLVELASVP